MTDKLPKATLLSIPTEVRVMIYEALMPPKIEFFSEQKCAATPHLRFRKRCGPRQQHARPLSYIDAITKVCKQLREEASEVLSKRTGVVHLIRYREGSLPVTYQPILYKVLENAEVVYCHISRLIELHDYGLPTTCHTLIVCGMYGPGLDDIIEGTVALHRQIAIQVIRERDVDALTSMVGLAENNNIRLLIDRQGRFVELAQGQFIENALFELD